MAVTENINGIDCTFYADRININNCRTLKPSPSFHSVAIGEYPNGTTTIVAGTTDSWAISNEEFIKICSDNDIDALKLINDITKVYEIAQQTRRNNINNPVSEDI